MLKRCVIALFPAGGGTAGPTDVTLSLTYYDFEKSHPDFEDISYVTISKPTYVASPYGAWPAASSSPAGDTFSSWYRSVATTNQEITGTIILAAQTGSIKRFVYYDLKCLHLFVHID